MSLMYCSVCYFELFVRSSGWSTFTASMPPLRMQIFRNGCLTTVCYCWITSLAQIRFDPNALPLSLRQPISTIKLSGYWL